MATLTFDTHIFIKRLIAAGMPEPQAEAVTALVKEAQDGAAGELATKGDLRLEVGTLRTDMAVLRTEIATAKNDILRWVVPLILAQMGLTLGLLVKLI